jgi:hypothetical protein
MCPHTTIFSSMCPHIYYYICVLTLLYLRDSYVSSYYYIGSHTAIWFLILLFVSSYVLQCTPAMTLLYVSSYCYMVSHTTVCVLICATIYASSRCYI